jgi:fucose permease
MKTVTVSAPLPLTATGFFSFIVTGALTAMVGPLLLEVRQRFGISEATAGLLVSSFFVGTFVITIIMALWPGWLVMRSRLLLATGLIAASTFLMALAPDWPLFVLASGLRGVGAGLLFVDVNGFFARGFASRGAAMLSLVNAAYGMGSFAGPLLVAVLPGNYQVPLWVGGGLSLVVVALAWLIPKGFELPKVEAPVQVHSPAASNQIAIALFMALLALSGAIETSLGTWIATGLVADGYSKSFAANITALYWAGQTIGRVVLAPLALGYSARQLLLGGLALIALALMLVQFPSLRVLGYVLAGFGIATPFSSGLTWLAQTFPGLKSATTLGLTGSLLGGTLGPPMVGLLITSYSAQILPSAVLTMALAGLALSVLLSLLIKAR